MVAISSLKEHELFLYSDKTLKTLKEFYDKKDFTLDDRILNEILKDINNNKKQKFTEKKYLEWIRHSEAFVSEKYSPKVVTSSWTKSVEDLLKEVWSKHFNEEDKISLAYMGKLGSRELNLSSDIDLIFFGEPGYLKKVRAFNKEVSSSELIPKGFELDFDLRPGGKDAPLICSPVSLGHHLWKTSDPWERYSYTRLRIELGHKEVIKKVEEIVSSFCYRKYLSSNFFHSFLNLRKTYRKTIDEKKIHIKLGEGGIRDVELFVQTHQILYGGKDYEFRDKSTFELIDLFIQREIHTDIFKDLKKAYHVLRQAEGVLHAHNVMGGFYWDKEKFSKGFNQTIYEALSNVKNVIDDYTNSSKNLFGRVSKQKSSREDFVAEIKKEIRNKKDLEKKALDNFSLFFPERNKRFVPYLNAILSQKSIKYSFIDLLCYSKFGCQILSRRPSLLDHFLLRKYDFSSLKGEELLNFLVDMKMVEKIVATNDFIKNTNLLKLGSHLTNSYESIIRNIMKDSQGLDLLFLGKMSTKEVGIKSDLDFIIIYDDEEVYKSSKLKLARKIFRDLSYSTIFGPLVPFDNNAGPMGTATPLVMSTKALNKFLKEKAKPWQKLMYLRHRRLFKEENFKYIKAPVNGIELDELFEILKQRLFRTDLDVDRLKLDFGGLFHTEYILGCMWLNIGKQPSGPVPLSTMSDELAVFYKDQSSLLESIKKSYSLIRKVREIRVIKDIHTVEKENFELLAKNGKDLETLSVSVFNGRHVKNEGFKR